MLDGWQSATPTHNIVIGGRGGQTPAKKKKERGKSFGGGLNDLRIKRGQTRVRNVLIERAQNFTNPQEDIGY